jgi:hypothetical protein
MWGEMKIVQKVRENIILYYAVMDSEVVIPMVIAAAALMALIFLYIRHINNRNTIQCQKISEE